MPLPVIDLIGLPSDSNSSFEHGPALAPNAIRRALWSDRGNLACEDGQEIGIDFELLCNDNNSCQRTNLMNDDHFARPISSSEFF